MSLLKKKKLPIGVSDFKEVIEKDYYYVDKTNFIKEIIDDGSNTILFTRPRRFGKTLNIGMMKYFFGVSEESNEHLFHDLEVWKDEEYREYQGKYPVIFLTFKDIKESNWEDCKRKIKRLIIKEYLKYSNEFEFLNLSEFDKRYIKNICDEDKDLVLYSESLLNLSRYLYDAYKKKVIVLIDEYDTPIQEAYMSGYHDELIRFIRGFFGSALKDNEYLEKGILTGILRIAKENIFSDLNNINIYTILDTKYGNYFGLLENEVMEMVKYYEVEENFDNIKSWYNGYLFGKSEMYNPWSMINYVGKWQSGLRAHWVNTSSNDLVKHVLTIGDEYLKKDLEVLIDGGEIERKILDYMVYKDVGQNADIIWTFLLFCGYLKVVGERMLEDESFVYKLKIPNKEIKSLYSTTINNWFSEGETRSDYAYMLDSLIAGNINEFHEIFEEVVLNSFSYFDVKGGRSEKVYHAFVLGMLVALSNTHEVKSNRESGYGRYDVMVIPRDISKIGIVFEFKKVTKTETLESALDSAMKQIVDKKYSQELRSRGISNIVEIGVAFVGKELALKWREV